MSEASPAALLSQLHEFDADWLRRKVEIQARVVEAYKRENDGLRRENVALKRRLGEELAAVDTDIHAYVSHSPLRTTRPSTDGSDGGEGSPCVRGPLYKSAKIARSEMSTSAGNVGDTEDTDEESSTTVVPINPRDAFLADLQQRSKVHLKLNPGEKEKYALAWLNAQTSGQSLHEIAVASQGGTGWRCDVCKSPTVTDGPPGIHRCLIHTADGKIQCTYCGTQLQRMALFHKHFSRHNIQCPKIRLRVGAVIQGLLAKYGSEPLGEEEEEEDSAMKKFVAVKTDQSSEEPADQRVLYTQAESQEDDDEDDALVGSGNG